MNQRPGYKKASIKEGGKIVQVEAYEIVGARRVHLYFVLTAASGPLLNYDVILRAGRVLSRKCTDADGVVNFCGKPVSSAYSLVSKATGNTLINIPLPLPGRKNKHLGEGKDVIAQAEQLLEKQSYSKALDVLKTALRKLKCPERRPEFYLTLSRALKACGKQSEAIRALSLGIRRVRKRQAFELLRARAVLYITTKRWKQALADVESGLVISRYDPGLWGARVLVFTKHPFVALQAFEESLRVIGKNPGTIVSLFQVLKLNNLGGTAQELLSGFMKGLDNNNDVLDLLFQLQKADYKAEARELWIRRKRFSRMDGGEWEYPRNLDL
ncbi:MAG: hypothetical protein Q7R35_14520 [Elusimicrobiota bacterium]|nr:hypothetical protein [Elusimicrobiota bacterium]